MSLGIGLAKAVELFPVAEGEEPTRPPPGRWWHWDAGARSLGLLLRASVQENFITQTIHFPEGNDH